MKVMVKMFNMIMLALFAIFISSTVYGANEPTCLKLKHVLGEETIVNNGTYLTVELSNGRKEKGAVLILNDKEILLQGEIIKLSTIKAVHLGTDRPEIYLGESATSQNKSIIAGLNTEDNSMRSYFLWYTKEFFDMVPYKLNIDKLFDRRYRTNEGWSFVVV